MRWGTGIAVCYLSADFNPEPDALARPHHELNPMDFRLRPGALTDRRGLFRQGLGRWIEGLVERTEERVVTRRYLRPPGALRATPAA